MTSTTVTSAPLMKPRPYRNPANNPDDDALPQVAVKDQNRFNRAQVETAIAQAVEDTENRALNPEEQTWKKRYADLRRHEQEKSAKFTKEISELNAKVTTLQAGTQNILPKNEADVEKWAKEFPEVYNIVRTVANKEHQSSIQALQAQIDDLKTQNIVSETQKALAILRNLHSDIDELQNSEDFHGWLGSQPQKLQDTIYKESDPYAAAAIIDLYKAKKGVKTTTPKPPAQDASLAVRTGGSTAVEPSSAPSDMIRESDIRKLSQADFTKYEAEIDKARAEGRIIYDISGKNR